MENKNRDYKNLIYALQFLFPLKNDADYAAVPELLPFVGLDGFLHLCKYFGGQSIKIPTLSELNSLLVAIELYTKIHVRNMTEETALHQTLREIGELPADAYKTYKRIAELYAEVENNG